MIVVWIFVFCVRLCVLKYSIPCAFVIHCCIHFVKDSATTAAAILHFSTCEKLIFAYVFFDTHSVARHYRSTLVRMKQLSVCVFFSLSILPAHWYTIAAHTSQLIFARERAQIRTCFIKKINFSVAIRSKNRVNRHFWLAKCILAIKHIDYIRYTK